MKDKNMIEAFSLIDRFFAAVILLSMLSLILSMLHTDILGDLTRTYPWFSGFLVSFGFFTFITNLENLLLGITTKNLTTLAFSGLVTGMIGVCVSGLFCSHLVIAYRSFREVITPELQM